MRIVIADDSRVERAQLTRILTQAGHEVVEQCENGEQAVAAVAKHKPDAVILDVVMPRMTGDAAAQEIAKSEYLPAIVFATKNSQKNLTDLADRLGAAVTVKMYKPEHVLGSLERAYGNRR